MDNYQLYRTNVKLGGQMKMDLIIDPLIGGNEDLIITDFHLSPISPYVPFNKLVNDYSLNYNHSDNITMFYKKISSNFYNCKINPLYTNEFPIISDDVNLDIHDSTYEMGCRRAQYSLYKKQFEFLCPLWLEHLEEEHDLEFELQIFTNSSSLYPISSRTLKLKTVNGQDYHNKFVNYFNNHLKKVGVLGEMGNDEIMSVYLHKNQATIAGLSVLNGDVKIKNLPNLVTNLTSREIPMMDFDNQIIEQFGNNKLISNQLYNFNICFNIDDLLHPTLRSQLIGKKLVLKIDVKYDGKPLEKVDFYSNYEYIPRKRSDYNYDIKYPTKLGNIADVTPVDESLAPNVLDYLKDNKYVDLIRKNKLSQDIIHWSLYDNNDYIFNLYKGFYGYSFDKDNNIVNHENYLYDNEPDLQVREYSVTKNNSNWCNILKCQIDNRTAEKIVNNISDNPSNYEKFFTKFSKGITWVNNVKYIIDDNAFDDKNVYIMSIVSKNIQNISGLTIDNVKFLSKQVNNKLFIILLTNDISNITYSKIKSISSDNEYINILKTILDSANSSINPPMVRISNTVDLQLADSPSLNSSEITYYKNNKSGGIVLRYSGKIKPTFIKSLNDINFNYTYSKLLVNDQNYGQYLKYKSTGYLPQYPSIGYTDIINIGKTIYEDIPENRTLNPSKIEYTIYKDSICYNLLPDISTSIESVVENEKYVKLNELVKRYIKQLYQIENDEVVNYIYSLYNYKNSFDYKEVDNINDYIYNVEIKLK